MIWDCCMFGGERELDLLELRLRTLGPYVDRFVIAEADITFQATPKPLAYPAAGDRFAEWADRICYVPVTAGELPDGDDPWPRERKLRDMTLRPLADAKPDDTVLLSDLDEIPDLSRWRPSDRPQVFRMRQHVFAVDWQHPFHLLGTLAVPWRLHRDDPQAHTWLAAREHRLKFRQHWGGWHFSWLGGPAAITAKIGAYCHTETTDEMEADNTAGRLYERGWVPWDKKQQTAVDVDGTWPEWIAARECPDVWFRPRPELYTAGQEPFAMMRRRALARPGEGPPHLSGRNRARPPSRPPRVHDRAHLRDALAGHPIPPDGIPERRSPARRQGHVHPVLGA